MICDRCKKEVPEDMIMPQGSQKVCEDCAMDMMSPSKACDPWAVKMATSSLGSKEDAIASLQPAERAIYDLVAKYGKVPREEVMKTLGITPDELNKSFGVLRHMELMRGEKRADGGVNLLPFDS